MLNLDNTQNSAASGGYNNTLYPYANLVFQNKEGEKCNSITISIPLVVPSPSQSNPLPQISFDLNAFLKHIESFTSRPKNTVKTAKSIITRFIHYLQGNNASNLSQEVIENYLAQFSSPATRYTIISFLRKFFDYLKIPDNPARKIPLPTVNYGIGIKYLESHELENLLAILDSRKNQNKNLREYAIILLILFSGMRVNEVLALKKQDWTGNEIFIRDSKNHEGRIVFIPQEVIEAMISYHKQDQLNSPYIFYPAKEKNKPLSYSSLWDKIKPLFDEAEIKGKSLHALRHTFARMLSLSGYKREQIQIFLGHKNIRTTEIYTKIFNFDVFKLFPDVHAIIKKQLNLSSKGRRAQ